MSATLMHLLLGSISVACLALITAALLWRLSPRPVAAHRILLGTVLLGLIATLAQLPAQGRGKALAQLLPEETIDREEESPLTLLALGIFAPPVEDAGIPSTTPETANLEQQTGDGPGSPPAMEDSIGSTVAAVSDPTLAALGKGDLVGHASETGGTAAGDLVAGGAASSVLSGLEIDWTRLLVALYLMGAAWTLMRLSMRLWQTLKLLRSARPASDPQLLALWAQLTKDEGAVRLLEIPDLAVPACLGYLNPAVLVPPADRLPRSRHALRCVLMHELVHLRRGDSWGLLAQEAFRVLFWFHPGAWWLLARLEFLREVSCDLLVVERTRSRKGYAKALLECAAKFDAHLGKSSKPYTSAAILPLSRSHTQLRRRIEMLFSKHPPRKGPSPWLSLGIAAASGALLCSAQVALSASFGVPVDSIPALSTSVSTTASQDDEIRIGITVDVVDAKGLGVKLKKDQQQLVRIGSVLDGSIADRCGLKSGDVIIKINGKTVHSSDDLVKARAELSRGTDLKVDLVRGDALIDVVLTRQSDGKLKRSVERTIRQDKARQGGRSKQGGGFNIEALKGKGQELLRGVLEDTGEVSDEEIAEILAGIDEAVSEIQVQLEAYGIDERVIGKVIEGDLSELLPLAQGLLRDLNPEGGNPLLEQLFEILEKGELPPEILSQVPQEFQALADELLPMLLGDGAGDWQAIGAQVEQQLQQIMEAQGAGEGDIEELMQALESGEIFDAVPEEYRDFAIQLQPLIEGGIAGDWQFVEKQFAEAFEAHGGLEGVLQGVMEVIEDEGLLEALPEEAQAIASELLPLIQDTAASGDWEKFSEMLQQAIGSQFDGGPIRIEVESDGKTRSLREFGIDEGELRESVQDALRHAQDAMKSRGQASGARGPDAAKLLDLAKRYYTSIDSENLGKHISEGIGELRKQRSQGGLPQEAEVWIDRVEELLDGDLEQYIGNVRERLQHVDVEEFKELMKAQRDATGDDYMRNTIERWKEFVGNFAGQGGRRAAPKRPAAQPARRASDIEARIRALEEEVAKRRAEVEALKRRIEKARRDR